MAQQGAEQSAEPAAAEGAASLPVLTPTEWALLAGTALTTLLLLLALRERVRVPHGPAVALGGSGAFPGPAGDLVVARGTTGAEAAARPALERRFALHADVLVLPVLADPLGRRPSWLQCHDLVDTWLWHESWLRASGVRPTVLEADGLLLDEAADAEPGRPWPVPAEASVAVLPVAEGVILSRPAAPTVGETVRRWRDRVRIWRAHAPHRAGAWVLAVQALLGPPLVVALPVVALVVAASPAVLAACFAPLAVGVLSALLRWAALDDLDRSTTVRVPVSRGALLVVTGPLHAALTWVAAVAALGPAPRQPGARGAGVPVAAGTGDAGEVHR